MASKLPSQVPAAPIAKPAVKPRLEDGRLKVKVFSPYETYYEGDAVSISAINKTGPFDVLYGHASFFSLLLSGDVVVQTGKDEHRFPINHGVVKVTNNVVTLFVNV
jgi:F0F1-type ATP synthase epsilon subunit